MLASLALSVFLGACGGGGGSETMPSAAPSAVQTAGSSSESLSAAAALGEQVFFDAGLSASGRLACANCHAPDHAHAQPDTRATPLGGPNNDVDGFRNAPSLRYLDRTPAFHFEPDGTPTGGFDRDGRAQTFAEQARRPFVPAHEMANGDAATVIDKLKRANYVEQFRSVFGAGILEDPDAAFDRLTFALAQYQKENAAFHPYDSKYDAFLAGCARLSEQELRGLALFNRGDKGNCAACHISGRGSDGSPPLFTDFTYDNLGVPRNAAIAANSDPSYYDLGLCGPQRTDLSTHKELCGAFKVPTLRNVEKTAPYFHNGRFATLKEAVGFYARRDTHPEEWYPRDADGAVAQFNDLPAEYHANVNVSEVPYNRKPGEMPALSASDIDDVVAFLNTLTDGYKP
ncbi:MAG: cytochrome-c peroxidase [Burkholderiaceae bacterium]